MMTISESQTRKNGRAAEIVWSSPASNLWVASSNGDYAGMVEFVDGHFSARSSTGALISVSTSIPAAQAAVAEHRETPLTLVRSALNLDAHRSLLSRAARPGYLRQNLSAA